MQKWTRAGSEDCATVERPKNDRERGVARLQQTSKSV